MKKIFLFTLATALLLVALLPVVTRAQMMGSAGNLPVDNQIAQEEATGKTILEKLQSKQTSCSNLTDDDFEKLGDYYMGQMMGNSHGAMDALMAQRIGETNNRLMHITLGKRLSGCDTSVAFPAAGSAFLPMMGGFGMMGGWSFPGNYQFNGSGSMMGNFGFPMMGYGLMGGGFGWVTTVLIWVLLILGIVALGKWVFKK